MQRMVYRLSFDKVPAIILASHSKNAARLTLIRFPGLTTGRHAPCCLPLWPIRSAELRVTLNDSDLGLPVTPERLATLEFRGTLLFGTTGCYGSAGAQTRAAGHLCLDQLPDEQ
ncbi:MAG TPA: hypothetical protein DDW52_15890 [Planctomycetaceae bacterium]|nr:hypothetical protein [Planctomycetaceae bacterium]